MNEIINLIQNKMGLMRKELEKKIEEIPFWQLKSLFSEKDIYSSQEEYKKNILNNYEKTNFLYQILEKDLSIKELKKLIMGLGEKNMARLFDLILANTNSKTDLDKAIKFEIEEKLKYLLSKDSIIHPNIIKFRNSIIANQA